MELICTNSYGACYKMPDAPMSDCKFLMIIDKVGIFLSENQMSNLLEIVRGSENGCDCKE